MKRSLSTGSIETAPSSYTESDGEISPPFFDHPPNRLLEDDADVLAHKGKLLPPLFPFTPSQHDEIDPASPALPPQVQELEQQDTELEQKLFQRLVKKVVRFHHDEGILYPIKLTPEEIAIHESKVSKQRESKTLLDSNEERSQVSFGCVHVHVFPYRLGDHPDCQEGGPPLCLDYTADEDDYTVSVESYEATRDPRRTLAKLRIPPHTRRYWLLKQAPCRRTCGQEMREAEQACRRIQQQRQWSQRLQSVQGLLLVRESLARRLKGVLPNKNDRSNPAAQWCREYKREQRTNRKTATTTTC
jgi:hypothetical protein